MNLKNRVTLIGNLGQDPELKDTENGKKYLTVNIATHEPYRNKEGEWVEASNWHRLKLYGKMSENMAKVCKKGSEVVAEGRLMSYDYEKDGQKKYITEVVVDNFLLLSRKSKDTEAVVEKA